MRCSTFQKLSVVRLISLSVPQALALVAAVGAGKAFGLLRRDEETCNTQSLKTCGGELPPNFCCPSGTACISLSGGSTAICCPANFDCALIQPIVCDITQQDPELYPGSMIHTTDLTTTLAKCGDACCPRGYRCEEGRCIMEKASSPSSSAPSSTTPTAPPTSTNIPSITLGPTNAAARSATAAPVIVSTTAFPTKAVLAGLFPGLVAGALIVLAALACLRNQRARKLKSSNTPNLTRVSRNVSDPIYDNAQTHRTDFLLRTSPGIQRLQIPQTPPGRTAVSSDYPYMTCVTPYRTPDSTQCLLNTAEAKAFPAELQTLPSTTFTPKSTVAPILRTPHRTPSRTSLPQRDLFAGTLRSPVEFKSTPLRATVASSKYGDDRSDDSLTRIASHSSSGTIDILMPPPPISARFPRHDPIGGCRPQSNAPSDRTSFGGLMERAGLGRYYWQHVGPQPDVVSPSLSR